MHKLEILAQLGRYKSLSKQLSWNDKATKELLSSNLITTGHISNAKSYSLTTLGEKYLAVCIALVDLA